MNSERWRQIEQLYHAALERAPDQRAAFFARACNGDEELRREVESLITQNDSSSRGPLDQPGDPDNVLRAKIERLPNTRTSIVEQRQ